MARMFATIPMTSMSVIKGTKYIRFSNTNSSGIYGLDVERFIIDSLLATDDEFDVEPNVEVRVDMMTTTVFVLFSMPYLETELVFTADIITDDGSPLVGTS